MGYDVCVGFQMECLCTNGVQDVCVQPAPPCAGCGRIWSFVVVNVSEGWERGGWEVSMCPSHKQGVSEDVVLHFLVTFNHPEAAESVC